MTNRGGCGLLKENFPGRNKGGGKQKRDGKIKGHEIRISLYDRGEIFFSIFYTEW